MANPKPNQEGLKRWREGQTGNPAGSSKGRRISAELNRLIDEKKAIPLLAEVWLSKALEGKFPWFEMLLDRIDGPPLGDMERNELAREKYEGRRGTKDLTELVQEAEERASKRRAERETDQAPD